jgi:FtsH-binding integral membrane protein
MFATFNTTPGTPAKYLSWTSFNLVQGLLLAPLCFVNPAILLRAGLYTTGIIGSISYVGATAKEEKFLYIGGPLIAGLSVVALSGLAPLVLPVTAMRTLAISEMISLVSLPDVSASSILTTTQYGGLAIFPFCTLNHVQTILLHARQGQHDAVSEAIAIELNFINIFIRLVRPPPYCCGCAPR